MRKYLHENCGGGFYFESQAQEDVICAECGGVSECLGAADTLEQAVALAYINPRDIESIQKLRKAWDRETSAYQRVCRK